ACDVLALRGSPRATMATTWIASSHQTSKAATKRSCGLSKEPPTSIVRVVNCRMWKTTNSSRAMPPHIIVREDSVEATAFFTVYFWVRAPRLRRVSLAADQDRKSTRRNSSHVKISYD